MKDIDAVFFDVDETIINFKTMFSFLEFYYKEKYGILGKEKFNIYFESVKEQWGNNTPREIINFNYYRQLSGESISDINLIKHLWLSYEKEKHGEFFYIRESRKLIDFYKEKGASIILVSGSMKEIIEPIAEEIKADTILATNVVIHDGILTGDIHMPQTIGEGKSLVVYEYLSQKKIKKENTIAFGDHISDFPMLRVTGKGVIISDIDQTISQALSNGFSVIDRRLGDISYFIS